VSKFRKVPAMTCGDIGASIYEGENGRRFVLVEETNSDCHSIALTVSEARALRNFLGAALGRQSETGGEHGA
jgi:hypothetical protein